MPRDLLHYHAGLSWQGNCGQGTASYNPEDLFLGALAACHMLVYAARP
jgi:organic hydroperoxide reductase OsmC/OhrA